MTDLRRSAYYLNTYIVVNFFVMTLAPVVILSVCHFLTFRKIRENTRMHNAISSHQGGLLRKDSFLPEILQLHNRSVEERLRDYP